MIMTTFLSIDWDFFPDAGDSERFILFPDSPGDMGHRMNKLVWDMRYQHHIDGALKSIGIQESYFDDMRERVAEFNGVSLISKNHKDMYDFVLKHTHDDEEFVIWNVDYHHDQYMMGDANLNDGNWVLHLQKVRPNMVYHWVGFDRSRSSVEPEPGKIAEHKQWEDLPEVGFDFIFLCRSDIYSPPHLDTWYIDLMYAIANQSTEAQFIADQSAPPESWCNVERTYPEV